MLTFNGTTVSLAQMFVWLVVAMLSGIIAEVLFGEVAVEPGALFLDTGG